MTRPVRRIVTGHDETGKSVFLEIGEPPQFHARRGRGVDFYELWNTEEIPVKIGSVPDKEPNDRELQLPPSANGVVVRILDIHPGHLEQLPEREDGRRKGMHRTQTLDFGIVIDGEIVMHLDEDEVVCGPGDVVIQRGTDHAWEIRGDKPCRIAFVLIDAAFTDELKAKLPNMQLQVKSFTQIPEKS